MNTDPADIAKSFLYKAALVGAAVWFLGHLANLWLAPKLRSFFRKANRAIGPNPTSPKPTPKTPPKPALTEARVMPGWEQLTQTPGDHDRSKP